jgi:hypothetical protein
MLKFAKFIGANTDFSTAQAYLFPRIFPDDFNEPVFGLVIGGEGEDIFIYVRQKVLNLEEQFSAPFERVTEKLHELAEIIKSEFAKLEHLKFTLFCAKENVFYVLQHGDNIVEIHRKGETSPIIQDTNLQEKVVSGFLQSGDKVLVLSGKPGEANWSSEVVEQVFNLPSDGIDDAEMIFAINELKTENQEDLAGVKNIEPVAFILVENLILIDNVNLSRNSTSDEKTSSPQINNPSRFSIPKPKINFKFQLPRINIWLIFHRGSRRLFGILRQINRKLLISLVVLILITVIAAGTYLFFQGRSSQNNQRLNNLTASIETGLIEAGNLKDSDPKQAAEKIAQVKSKLEEAKGLDKDGTTTKDLQSQIESKEAEVLKIYKGFNLDLFLSLDLIKQSFKTQRMSFSVGKILLLDSAEKSLVSIDTELKTPNILAGPQQLGAATMASLNGSHAFVYSPDKGITHTDIDTKKTSVVSKADPEWGSIADIFAFSGNIYALDIGKGKIWKYAPTESGYSGRLEYLRQENVDLALGKKLVIDYSVWVLTSQPDILKFTAGNSDFFALSGLTTPLTQIDNLSIPEELDSVFILDKFNNRILVTKKNGEYLAQYISDQFGKVDDFFVDEEQKQIYLLIENKIYRTSLR